MIPQVPPVDLVQQQHPFLLSAESRAAHLGTVQNTVEFIVTKLPHLYLWRWETSATVLLCVQQ